MAVVTITTTAPQDARLGPAFGKLLNGGGTASAAEVKTWLIAQLRSVVQAYEQQEAVNAIPPPAGFDPT